MTAISFHAYPYLQDNYTLMGCGGSVGEGYGPMVVSSKPLAPEDLEQHQDRRSRHPDHGLPGAQDLQPRDRDRDRALRPDIPEILAGKFEAGLIIHEGQLTYSASGLHKVVDLGVWWRETTGLVLPLGGNAIRRSLGAESCIVTKAVHDSIQHASTTASRRWNTPCSLPATWTRAWPAALSACM